MKSCTKKSFAKEVELLMLQWAYDARKYLDSQTTVSYPRYKHNGMLNYNKPKFRCSVTIHEAIVKTIPFEAIAKTIPADYLTLLTNVIETMASYLHKKTLPQIEKDIKTLRSEAERS